MANFKRKRGPNQYPPWSNTFREAGMIRFDIPNLPPKWEVFLKELGIREEDITGPEIDPIHEAFIRKWIEINQHTRYVPEIVLERYGFLVGFREF